MVCEKLTGTQLWGRACVHRQSAFPFISCHQQKLKRNQKPIVLLWNETWTGAWSGWMSVIESWCCFLHQSALLFPGRRRLPHFATQPLILPVTLWEVFISFHKEGSESWRQAEPAESVTTACLPHFSIQQISVNLYLVPCVVRKGSMDQEGLCFQEVRR